MSSLPVFSPEVEYQSPRHAPQGNNGKKRIVKLILKILIGIFILALGIELLFYFTVSDQMHVKRVQVIKENSLSLSREEIVSYSGIGKSTSLLHLDREALIQKLTSHPEIRDASVKIELPDLLKITVSGRAPVAVIISGKGTEIFAVDEEGIVFLHKNQQVTLPIISSPDGLDVKSGDMLSKVLLPLLHTLGEMKSSGNTVYRLISEIELIRISEYEYECLLYFTHSRLPVRTDLNINVEIIKNILLMLDLVDKQQISSQVEELDFRSGHIVMKMREE